MSVARVVREKNDAQIKLLLERNDPRLKEYLFDMAAYYGNAELIERLLKDFTVDPAHNNNRPLRVAVSRGHLDVVALLARDARSGTEGALFVAHYMAIEGGYHEMAKMLGDMLDTDPFC
jgi:hypothetical protein